MTKFNFQIDSIYKNARSGVITTAHGKIRTPAFMPVGTQGTVKAMFLEDVNHCGADIILGNTYHLMLRPGTEVIKKFSGLHNFINWQKPILTDSGGYQVMSLAKIRKITESGVEFQSHINGEKIYLTPEISINYQHILNSTITMAFDECTPYPAVESIAAESMRMSMRWAKKSKDAFIPREGYALFGINQGSVYPHLRKESVERLEEIDFHGYAIGGLAVGEGQELMFETLDHTTIYMDKTKPRYLMGVGKPDDILGAVHRGVDMFDCVLPTRSGRNAQAFTRNGAINIKRAEYKLSDNALDRGCKCYTCQNYSLGYLHHLVKAKEILAAMLLTYHNTHFYQELMQKIRDRINTQNLPYSVDALFAE